MNRFVRSCTGLVLGMAVSWLLVGCDSSERRGDSHPARTTVDPRSTAAATMPTAGAMPSAGAPGAAAGSGTGVGAAGASPGGELPADHAAAGGGAGTSAHSAGAGPNARDAGTSAQPNDAGNASDAGKTTAPNGSVAPSFILGADISSVHEHDYEFVDTDGKTKTIFELLKHHGFNYVRVKTFVDPDAAHGYASTAGGCAGLPEPFSDRDHVVAFGRKIKLAGMGFLLDFHYSDVWADPGKQIIPAAWRDATSLDELAARMKAYTKDVLMTAIAAGARPDMVQVGNEITSGILMHVPGPDTDCWGNHPELAPIGGSASNWDDFSTLLRAGIEAVREVDSTIQIMLHIENTDDRSGALRWVDNALRHDLDFDVLGLSCYTAFQGDPSVWAATLEALADAYPQLEFAIAEYNPERTQANLIVHDLPNGRGLGTFLWEPTQSGAWGSALFTEQGNTMTANATDFEEFDALAPRLGL